MCAKEKLRKQANKAYFPMLNVLHKIDFEAVPSLHLFDSFNQLSKRNKAAIVKGIKRFWNTIKNLQNDNNVNLQNPIEYEAWEEQLYSCEPQGNKFINQSISQEPFQNHDVEAIDQIINRVTIVNEVKQAIRKLKKSKAAEDSIINEVLKTGEFCLAEPITKLLNLIFT